MKNETIAFGFLNFINSYGPSDLNSLTDKPLANEVISQETEHNYIKKQIIQNLLNRGLETQAVKKVMPEYINITEEIVSRLENILEGVSFDDIINVLAKRVLYRQSIDIADKEVLISIVQSLGNMNITSQKRSQLFQVTSTSNHNSAA